MVGEKIDKKQIIRRFNAGDGQFKETNSEATKNHPNRN